MRSQTKPPRSYASGRSRHRATTNRSPSSRRSGSAVAGNGSAPAAIGEMNRVLVPGGRLLLLDHIGSTWPPIQAAQWLLERLTIRAAGEHFTRRQLPLVRAAGFEVVEV